MNNENNNWYQMLKKSKLTPPPIVFPIVWSFLYMTMVVSLATYIYNVGLTNPLGLTFFIIQLILNLSWSPVFFRFRRPDISLMIVLLMLVFIFLTIWQFLKVSPISGYILIPYLVWVSLASYLNFYIWMNN